MAGHAFPPQNCPFPRTRRDLDSHLKHGSLSPLEPITQTASRSVQPFYTAHVTVTSGMSGQALPHENRFFPWGSGLLSNRLFSRSTRLSIPNQTASRSVQPCLHSSRRQSICFTVGAPFPKKPLPMGHLDPHLMHGFLFPTPEFSTQTASRSVQPFFQGSLL